MIALSANFEFEAIIETKNFALTLEGNDASGAICSSGYNRSASLRNWVADLPELSGSNIFVFSLVCIL